MPLGPSSKSRILSDAAQVTVLLRRASAGERPAEDALLALIYAQLRSLAAREFRRHGPAATSQATAVVHDLYMKLLREDPQAWPDRRYFFAAFARAVHDRLVDQIRRRGRRGRHEVLTASLAARGERVQEDELVVLRESLAQLDTVQPRCAEALRARYFLGLTTDEIASALGVGRATVERDLRFARTWLHAKLRS